AEAANRARRRGPRSDLGPLDLRGWVPGLLLAIGLTRSVRSSLGSQPTFAYGADSNARSASLPLHSDATRSPERRSLGGKRRTPGRRSAEAGAEGTGRPRVRRDGRARGGGDRADLLPECADHG